MTRRILLPEVVDPRRLADDIGDFIVRELPSFATGGVLGMSGGIDSSVVAGLAQRAFARHNEAVEVGKGLYGTKLGLLGYALPSSLNSPADAIDAKRAAASFGVELRVVDLQAAVRAMEETIPSLRERQFDRGNMVSRLRANVLWTYAALEGKVVIGTGNRDEDYGVGYYTLGGDGLVYMNPIGCLSKRLVRAMGRFLGLPDDLVLRVATAGLEPLQSDARDLGYSYAFVELVIEGLDQGFPVLDLVRHPQVVAAFEGDEEGMGKWVQSGVGGAVLDVIHRHEVARKKAALICPKVPEIKLPYTDLMGAGV